MTTFKVFKKVCSTGELTFLEEIQAEDKNKAIGTAIAKWFTQLNMMKELVEVRKA